MVRFKNIYCSILGLDTTLLWDLIHYIFDWVMWNVPMIVCFVSGVPKEWDAFIQTESKGGFITAEYTSTLNITQSSTSNIHIPLYQCLFFHAILQTDAEIRAALRLINHTNTLGVLPSIFHCKLMSEILPTWSVLLI